MARRKKAIDPRIVAQLARIHCTYAEIAAVVDCSVETLKRRFVPLIETSRENGKASLRRMQFAKAMDGNITMLIWLGKQFLDQKEARFTHELTGKDGGPIETADLSMPDELRERLAQRFAGIASRLMADGFREHSGNGANGAGNGTGI